MKRLFIATAIVFLSMVHAGAKDTKVVWENPTTEFGTEYGDGFFNITLDVTKVELKETETVVYLTVHRRSGYSDMWFQFAGETYLKVGDQRYTVTSADGIELNQHTLTNKDGKLDIALHFQPLPQGTKSFDFIEGDGDGAFQIKGIKPVEERWKQLLPSYWLNDKTGDWEIAFLEEGAIYQCKFWNYKECELNHITGEAEMVITDGNEELKVKVGKDKKGKRTMQIGGQKVTYSMITSRFMPDYPTKDTRTDFVDTGYKTDTVTVVGWLKDMPEHYKKEKTFEFGYENIFTDEQESVRADLDEQGHFTVKIPVLNSTEFFCDWSRCFIRTMLEPGKTYFMLYDFKEGRRYFMGEDARLQNELFKYPLDWKSIRMEKGEDLDHYIASVDSLLKAQYAYIDELCKTHPTLSTRFNLYRKGNTLCQQARDFGQARFYTPNYQLSDNARKYAYDTFWTKMEEPYTLHRDLSTFLRDYLGDVSESRASSFSWKVQDHIAEYTTNDEELALLTRWKEWITEAQARVDAASTTEEKEQIAEELNAENADLITKVQEILNGPKAIKLIKGKSLIAQIKDQLPILDSLHAAPIIRDTHLFQIVYQGIDHHRCSLLPEVIDTLKALTSHPLCVEMVEKRNDHYLAIENREFDKLVLKSSDNLKDISEGEALLKKILEPFKGKLVLLDIWGTWCGPCKEALKHSTEEYAQLKDYDIEFLYLANSSPMDSWENIIKEYNVTGDNVAHYNLPREQQSAIERYLDIHAFPTYKLFDREGNLLDLKVDARDLDNLEYLIKQLTGK
ncbi:MAG: redoxin domain-containing protein [Bacteroidaceae bacterium]|nr:redoxin domain-containing protein [Bacteroidaceae bacterium]